MATGGADKREMITVRVLKKNRLGGAGGWGERGELHVHVLRLSTS